MMQSRDLRKAAARAIGANCFALQSNARRDRTLIPPSWMRSWARYPSTLISWIQFAPEGG
jgi:hypothetical protein